MTHVPEKPKTVALKKVSKRGRGRPRKIELLPDNPVVAQIEKEREEHLKKDRLIKKLRKNPNSLDVLDQMLEDLAFEASLLGFERSEQARHGKDISVTAGKRITALKTIADLYFKKRDSVLEQSFDFKSQRFEKLMKFILMEIVMKSAQESGFSPEEINNLFDSIGQKLDDDHWTEDAMTFIKS